MASPRCLGGEEYGRGIWQATVNDGDDPSAAIQIYNYDWGYDQNGIAVLNGITPRQWLNEKTQPCLPPIQIGFRREPKNRHATKSSAHYYGWGRKIVKPVFP